MVERGGHWEEKKTSHFRLFSNLPEARYCWRISRVQVEMLGIAG